MNQPETLTIKAALKVAKPAQQVFEAIADPAHMSHYFISQSSGRMEAGKTLQWQFPEFEGQFPVRVQQVEPNRLISFNWDDMDGTETKVTITLQPMNEATFVTVTEGSKPNNEANIGWLMRNTEGWANFLACLKAYLEYGINLRKGAFDLSQMPDQEK
jgi:uncharacterized protein YndB with AHSA1/START domain